VNSITFGIWNTSYSTTGIQKKEFVKKAGKRKSKGKFCMVENEGHMDIR